MPSVGRVTVSERRSMALPMAPELSTGSTESRLLGLLLLRRRRRGRRRRRSDGGGHVGGGARVRGRGDQEEKEEAAHPTTLTRLGHIDKISGRERRGYSEMILARASVRWCLSALRVSMISLALAATCL